MKKTFLFLASILITISVFAQDADSISYDLSRFEDAIVQGTELTYAVDFNGTEYFFIITINEVGKTISFDWEMTSPVDSEGTVNMAPDAVENAMALFNYFTGGTSNLSDETSVWLSQKAFKEAKENRTVNLRVNGADSPVAEMEVKKSEISTFINYETPYIDLLDLPALELSNENYKVVVIDSELFPVIAKMDLGWTISIVSIDEP